MSIVIKYTIYPCTKSRRKCPDILDSIAAYVCIVAQKKYKSAYAKFRCGVALIKIETGRYAVERVPPESRLCMQCIESMLLTINREYKHNEYCNK